MRLLASYRKPSALASQHAAFAAVLSALTILANSPATRAQPPAATPATQGEATDADALDEALRAQPAADAQDNPQADSETQEHQLPEYLPPPEQAKRLDKQGRAWIDRQKGVVYADGRISLRRGVLEMFACPRNTKEHESIVSVECKAFVIHAGLLAVGADTGTPVQFVPEYKPPTGTEIEIIVHWRDREGKMQQAKAQQWVRDARTGTQMDLPWVFAGSGFWRNEETGTSGYMAESGDLVCVANFSTATLDVPAQISNDNSSLLYEAYTDRVPPLGWPVRLEFKPVTKRQPGDTQLQTPAPSSPPAAE